MWLLRFLPGRKMPVGEGCEVEFAGLAGESSARLILDVDLLG
jgi:hypothetical protein